MVMDMGPAIPLEGLLPSKIPLFTVHKITKKSWNISIFHSFSTFSTEFAAKSAYFQLFSPKKRQ